MILIYYLSFINILGLLIMKIDKIKAIKSKNRISEKTIWIISLLGGSLGTTIGMFIFHHKNKKINFLIGLPLILIIETIFLFKYYK